MAQVLRDNLHITPFTGDLVMPHTQRLIGSMNKIGITILLGAFKKIDTRTFSHKAGNSDMRILI
jgi:hypothetical protein